MGLVIFIFGGVVANAVKLVAINPATATAVKDFVFKYFSSI